MPEKYRFPHIVFQLAHDSMCGNHLGMRKLRKELTFFFLPNLSKDVENCYRMCEKCQMKSPERKSDKISITHVIRVHYPFHTVNIDIIG